MPLLYTVEPGDTPASIAQRLTGDERHASALVDANPHKETSLHNGAPTFETLTAGEKLAVPASYAAINPRLQVTKETLRKLGPQVCMCIERSQGQVCWAPTPPITASGWVCANKV